MNGRVTEALRRTAHVVLALVAVVGVVLSWDSLYAAATPTFGPVLAAGFPLLADALAAGASLMYVSGVRQGQGRHGWRVTAHAAIAGTIVLNAMAAPTVGEVPWHVTAPAVWAVLVELYAREAAGQWKAEHVAPKERIPLRLWVTAPVESGRTWLLQGRTGVAEHGEARFDVGLHAAAVEALRLAIPGPGDAKAVRRILRRQLRAGSMPPAAVLAAVGWTGSPVERTPEAVLRAALRGVLTDTQPVGDEAGEPAAATAVAAETTVPECAADAPEDGPDTPAAPAPPVRQRATRRGGRRTAKTARRATDGELLARVDALVESGELAPDDVTGNRLRDRLGVGGERGKRLAEQWTEQHRRAAVRAVPAAAGS